MEARDLFNKTSNEVLDLCGQQNSVPVNLKKILECFNISATAVDFDEMLNKEEDFKDKKVSVLGAMISDEDNVSIFYNSKDKEDSHRYRFTIAHELAHCCLHSQLSHIELRMDPAYLSSEELKVNIFAGEILIPKDTLLRVKEQLFMPSIHTLADIFEVSDNVMRARLEHLNMLDQVYN